MNLRENASYIFKTTYVERDIKNVKIKYSYIDTWYLVTISTWDEMFEILDSFCRLTSFYCDLFILLIDFIFPMMKIWSKTSIISLTKRT